MEMRMKSFCLVVAAFLAVLVIGTSANAQARGKRYVNAPNVEHQMKANQKFAEQRANLVEKCIQKIDLKTMESFRHNAITCTFSLDNEGQIISVKLLDLSKKKRFEKIVIQALTKCGPYPSFGKGIEKKFFIINFGSTPMVTGQAMGAELIYKAPGNFRIKSRIKATTAKSVKSPCAKMADHKVPVRL